MMPRRDSGGAIVEEEEEYLEHCVGRRGLLKLRVRAWSVVMRSGVGVRTMVG